MKIAINALSASIGGGVTYLNRLLYHLHQVDQDNEYYVFVTAKNKDKVLAFHDPRFHAIEVRLLNLFHRVLYEQLCLPLALRRLKVDVLYAPAEVAPLLAPCPVVLGIQNPNPYYEVGINWSWKAKCRKMALRAMARLSARRARRVIFVSESCRSYISRRLDIPPSKTMAVLHGVDADHFRRPQKKLTETASVNTSNLGLGRDYILFVSNMSGHKNHRVLVEAYARLDAALRRHHKLVLVGKRQSPWSEEVDRTIEKYGLNGSVIFAGEVHHSDIPAYYMGAAVFVMPSLLETFGMPLVEAMASGVPVIGADATAIPEVIGDAGLLFNPRDPDELADKIEKVLTQQDLRKNLIEKGLARAMTFSWTKCASETLSVLLEATGK